MADKHEHEPFNHTQKCPGETSQPPLSVGQVMRRYKKMTSHGVQMCEAPPGGGGSYCLAPSSS